ncbi:hypothetical protein D9756_008234 [Leucocoprinus leucothites]|uniref:Enoyl reductase (ER) domain-containing protein n=1 Tax=Leucocoprinus leucothites TaxID=201217 RepID=A0A8H5D1D9_9AGAR|nr:hypothetical protein D9756_008234 [Leucoagaricus leucothites]
MTIPKTTRQYQLSKVGSYDNLEVREAPVSPPKAYEALVKVHAVSLNYRDLLITKGMYISSTLDQAIPCSDMAGEVIAIGEGVKDWKIGDRVCANFSLDHIHGNTTPEIQATSLGAKIHGVLTHYRTFPTHSLVRVPEHYSYEDASTLPCAALTAYNALLGLVPVKAGDYVLALGLGGVSTWGLQFALASGATVIATSSSDEKLEVAAKLGAQHLINYKKTPNWDEEVLKITNGVGVDHVIEVGGQGTLGRSMNSVRIGGCINIIGIVSQDAARNDANFIANAIGKAAVMRGIFTGSVAQFRDMIRLITANPEKTKPIISKVFSFDQALDAFKYMDSGEHVGKVVIKVT